MKYPSGILKQNNNTINYSNRGMSLEADINQSNEYYLLNNIAIIHKKPIPITINKVDYPNRKDAVIKEAYFKIPSTTDYNGIYKSKYIDFEAKETNSKTSFPLVNIHHHQLLHLENISKHGGIAFLIIRFNRLDKNFIVMIEDILKYINITNKKSLPITFFEEFGKEIKFNFNPRIDYLKIIDNFI